MVYTIFDIETDNLLDKVSVIHCLSYCRIENGFILDSGTLTDYVEILEFLREQEALVGHNIIRYDLVVLEKIIGFRAKDQLIVDTLALSWYLYPNEINTETNKIKTRKHGLEYWGFLLGIKKPEILDWVNLPLETYIERCEEDVKINVKLFTFMMSYLTLIYDNDITILHSFIRYLSFKMDCLREQEEVKCKIDTVKCLEYLKEINILIAQKTEDLAKEMPKVPKYKIKSRPKNYYKKDGSLSSNAIKWEMLCDKYEIPYIVEEIKYISHYEEPNPNSNDQKKDWLYSLGWEPSIFLERKNTKGEMKTVEQISQDGKICENIKELYDSYPYLENLEGLTILAHRKGVFEGFLKAVDENNYVVATADGFTNTLRLMHRKPIANLTKVGKPWGKEIRSLIIKPDDDHILCGSDMSSLEDTTKQHYMYYFDPEYVKQMRVPGFDPHIDIGVLANLITKEEEVFFKKYNALKEENNSHEFTEEENIKYKSISKKRSSSKTVNFAGVYGAGPPKIAKTLKCDLEFAKTLHTTYWMRNIAVKKVASSVTTKTIVIPRSKELNLPSSEQIWLYNPVSKFWYSLRAEKDIFSTLNQGTGVFCFDCWVKQMRNRGIKMSLQYHDEVGFPLLKLDKEKVLQIKEDAIKEVNKMLNLNVPLGASAEFGEDYSQIH